MDFLSSVTAQLSPACLPAGAGGEPCPPVPYPFWSSLRGGGQPRGLGRRRQSLRRSAGHHDLGALHSRCAGARRAFNSIVALIWGGLCAAFTGQMARALPCPGVLPAGERALTLGLEAKLYQDL